MHRPLRFRRRAARTVQRPAADSFSPADRMFLATLSAEAAVRMRRVAP